MSASDRGARLRESMTLVLVLLSGLLPTSQSFAHFEISLQANLAVYHLDHRVDGLDVLARVPMPYLVQGKVGKTEGIALAPPPPFTKNRMQGKRTVYDVDWQAIAQNRQGLGEILEHALIIKVGGQRIRGTVIDTLVQAAKTSPAFDTREQAIARFDLPTRGQAPFSTSPLEQLYVGDAWVDVHLRFLTESLPSELVLGTSLSTATEDQSAVVSMVLEHSVRASKLFSVPGLLNEPIVIPYSEFADLRYLLGQGVKHVLEGLDHVLFVLCLPLGAATLKALIWRVTGFTSGHSVTLSLGFLGYTPSGEWFVPAVEVAIATSIVYAAWMGRRRQSFRNSNLQMLGITAFIGLIHGLGFSFVLENVLRVGTPDLWQKLLAFNIGIELGQLSIVLVVTSLGLLLRRLLARWTTILRDAALVSCAAIACYWVVDRSIELLA